jgi:hypothetical protein
MNASPNQLKWEYLANYIIMLPFENGPRCIFGINFTQDVSGGKFDTFW